MNARDLKRAADETQNRVTEQCSFCVEKPTGHAGHPGLALHVHKIPLTIRTHVRVTCSFCGTHWARRRMSAKNFEWCRLAD
jgi:hypothetical protein